MANGCFTFCGYFWVQQSLEPSLGCGMLVIFLPCCFIEVPHYLPCCVIFDPSHLRASRSCYPQRHCMLRVHAGTLIGCAHCDAACHPSFISHCTVLHLAHDTLNYCHCECRYHLSTFYTDKEIGVAYSYVSAGTALSQVYSSLHYNNSMVCSQTACSMSAKHTQLTISSLDSAG